MHGGARWDSVDADGCTFRRCATEPEESWLMSDANGRVGHEGGGASVVGA